MNKHPLAHAGVLVAAFGWGLGPVMIRYLSGDYAPYTQAFIRYLVATAVLIAYGLLFERRELARALRHARPLIGVAAFNVIGMAAWTVACYSTTATTAQLVTKMHLPCVIALSYLCFREERRIIRSPLFLGGTVMGLIGVAAVLIEDPSASLLPTFGPATLLLLVVSVFWASYTISSKHMVAGLHPVAMFTVVCFYSTVALGALSCLFERPINLFPATPWHMCVVVLSSVLPIAIGHSAYHYGQKHLGAAYCSSLLLVTPIVANIAGTFLWEDERMAWLQWLGAAVLLAGSFFVIHAGRTAGAGAEE